MSIEDFTQRIRSLLEKVTGKSEGDRARRLLRATAREMERRRQKLLEATYVPDTYRVALSTDDLAALGPLVQAVEKEIATHLEQEARRKGYRVAGPIDFKLVEDASMASGGVRAEASFVRDVKDAPEEPPVPAALPDEETADRATRLIEPERETRLRQPPWQARIVQGPEQGRVIVLGDAPVTLGRGRDADVRLDDPSEFLSRVHVRLSPSEGRLRVEDLGSANGTFVDGAKIDTIVLSKAARMSLGDLQIELEPPPAPGSDSGE